MARRLIQYQEITDDLDGTQLTEENRDVIELAVDGTVYELDLTLDNATELRDFLARYTEVAHEKWKMPPRKTPKKASVPIGPPVSENLGTARHQKMMRDRTVRKHIRQWARDNGYPQSDTGAIRADALLAYRESNPGAYIPASTAEVLANVS